MMLVDTNHWMFYLDDDAPEHPRVAGRLETLLDEEPLLQTTIIQLEVAHIAQRRWPSDAAAPVGLFLGLPATVVGFSPTDFREALVLLERHAGAGVGGRDASVLQAALKEGASLLLTGDKALARAGRKEGLEVRDLSAR